MIGGGFNSFFLYIICGGKFFLNVSVLGGALFIACDVRNT